MIQIWAPSEVRRMLVRDIATALGGRRYARTRDLESRAPALMAELGTRLLIVNNAHQLGWRQWRELLTLDDIYYGAQKRRLGIVFSSVLDDIAHIPGLPTQPELQEQISERLKCRRDIPGHSLAEMKTALEKLLVGSAPELAAGVARHYELVFTLLMRVEVNPRLRKSVGTGRLLDLVRWIVALRAKDKTTRVDKLIREAYVRYVQETLPKGEGTLARIDSLVEAEAA